MKITNKNLYADFMLDLAIRAGVFALDEDGIPFICNPSDTLDGKCDYCAFKNDCFNYQNKFQNWLNLEACNFMPLFDLAMKDKNIEINLNLAEEIFTIKNLKNHKKYSKKCQDYVKDYKNIIGELYYSYLNEQ